MNILFVHSSADLYGSDRSLLKILKFCMKAGFKPFVCLPYKGPLVEEVEKLGVHVRVFDLGVVRRGYLTPSGILRIIRGNITGIFRLLKIIQEEKIDIVHTNTSVVFAGAAAAKISGRPHIWHVREIRDFSMPAGWIYAVILDLFSTKIICVSNAVKENLMGYRPKIYKKLTVIHNGIEAAGTAALTDKNELIKKYDLPDGKILCGFVGRINRVKGADYFVKIASEIKKSFSGAYFIICGDVFGNDKRSVEGLRDQIKSLGLENDVRLLGFVKDIQEILGLIDIYLFTSTMPDSFPATILEAMSAGKPVVANDTGGAKEIVADGVTGFLVRQGDTAGFAAAILKLIQDEDLRKRMGGEGRKRCVAEFSVDRFEEELGKVYEDCDIGD